MIWVLLGTRVNRAAATLLCMMSEWSPDVDLLLTTFMTLPTSYDFLIIMSAFVRVFWVLGN